MDSDATSTAAFGRLILLKKEKIIDIWRLKARKVFGPYLEQSLLDNKIPALMEVVAEALGATLSSPQSAEAQTAHSVEHGLLRAKQGFTVVQVTREFSLLRRAVRESCVKEGRPLTEEALDIVAGVIDTAAAIALGRFGEIREARIREEDARKMSFIVHDFRTPVGAIALALAETREAIPPSTKNPELMESLATIERNVEQLSIEMEKTMRELSSVFSEQELRITHVRLHEAAAKVIEQLKPPARAKNVLIFNRIDEVVEVAAAPNALHRILMNLISNALRYTRDGSITLSSFQKGTEIEVVVQDTGQGILPEKLARIFEPGEKEFGSPGMGFGLAIAKYLAELQGGRIQIESTVHKGTMVIFALPRRTP